MSHFADEFAYVARYVSQSAFQFGFLRSNRLFPLKSSLEFVLHRGKPKFISLPVKFPDNRSKFQFCTSAGSMIIPKKEGEEKREQSRDRHDDIRGELPIQFLTPPDRA